MRLSLQPKSEGRAIAEWTMMQKIHASQPMLPKEGYLVTINVREGDSWKIGMLYWSYK